MKTKIKSAKPHQALASMLAWTSIAVASLALTLGASAQTVHPQPANVKLRPAIIDIPVGPTLPSGQMFGFYHAYAPADMRPQSC